MSSYYDYGFSFILSIHKCQGNISETQFWSCHSLIQHPWMGNSSLQKESKFLNIILKSQLAKDSRVLLNLSHHCITNPPFLLKSLLSASISPVQLFLSIFNVLSQLFNLKLRDCLYFWFCNPGVHLNGTYWFIHNWSWIKEIGFQFCSFSSVLWWWLRKKRKGRELTITLSINQIAAENIEIIIKCSHDIYNCKCTLQYFKYCILKLQNA